MALVNSAQYIGVERYINIHPFSKTLQFGNIEEIYVPFVFSSKRDTFQMRTKKTPLQLKKLRITKAEKASNLNKRTESFPNAAMIFPFYSAR